MSKQSFLPTMNIKDFILLLPLMATVHSHIICSFENSTLVTEDRIHSCTLKETGDSSLQVKTSILSRNSSSNSSLLMIGSYNRKAILWQLPDPSKPTLLSLTKTLCSSETGNSSNANIELTVLKNEDPIEYKIEVEEVSLYSSGGMTSGNFTLTKDAPLRLKLKLEDKSKYHVLEVRNMSTAVCTLVSVHPEDDCLTNSLNQGYSIRQSMLEQSSIVIDPVSFTKDYVYVVVSFQSSNKGCSLSHSAVNFDVDQLSVHLRITTKSENVLHSVLAVIGIYVAIGAFILMVYCYGGDFEPDGNYNKYENKIQKQKRFLRNFSRRITGTKDVRNGRLEQGNTTEGQPMTSMHKVDIEAEAASKQFEEPNRTEEVDTVDGDEEVAQATSNPINPHVESKIVRKNSSPRGCYWQKSPKTWSEDCVDGAGDCVDKMASNYNKDIKTKTKADRHERDSSYCWLTGLMGIFYTLPVLQLVLYHQTLYRETGDEDVCYYNFRCISEVLIFEDFGHVFSNLSYILSGVFFILIVRRRKMKYKELIKTWQQEPKHHPENCSIPEQFGIYEALGLALIMEGVLSACYHICPTTKNFQFDTTFMYTIAILIYLKVYQFRHPDVTQKARIIFLIIGVFLTLEVVGYYTANPIFWFIFVVISLMIVSYFIIDVNTEGVLTNFKKVVVEYYSRCKANNCWSLGKTVTVVFANIIICGVILYLRKPGVSRYILMIIVSNMVLYVLYYIVMKCYYSLRRTDYYPTERMRKTTLVYFILSLTFAGIAMYYFRTERKKSSLSAAESRNLNMECEIGIFDTHDLWHFFSSAGLLFMFMFLLTLEDKNIGILRVRIPMI